MRRPYTWRWGTGRTRTYCRSCH
ncbi:MAG: hypothetical protein AB8C95_07695 [Phycisphaeraceae bacterium]